MTPTPTAPENETAGQMLQRLGMDGRLWAQEFCKTAIELGYSDMDEGWLIGWFANAIMAGYDESQRRAPQPTAPGCREVGKTALTVAYLKSLGADPKVQDAIYDPTDPFSIAWHKREDEHRRALQSTRPQPKVAAALREALKFLILLKDEKVKYGETEFYKDNKGVAWENARNALRTLDQILTGEAAPEAAATPKAEADVERVAEALYLSFYPSGKFDLQKHKAWLNHAKAAIAAMGQPPKGEPHAD